MTETVAHSGLGLNPGHTAALVTERVFVHGEDIVSTSE